MDGIISSSQMNGGSETDEELLERLRRGDEEAFVELYHRRQGAIYRFTRHMSGSATVAEDVTQEVFLVLIRRKFGYDPGRGTLGGYLLGIARKLVLRHLEKGWQDVALDFEQESMAAEPVAYGDPLADLTRRESIEAVQRAVLALPPRYREVVVLCDLEEVDYADAALVLGCPIGTVRSRLHRARALLLEKLSQERNPRPAVNAWKPVRCLI